MHNTPPNITQLCNVNAIFYAHWKIVDKSKYLIFYSYTHKHTHMHTHIHRLEVYGDTY